MKRINLAGSLVPYTLKNAIKRLSPYHSKYFCPVCKNYSGAFLAYGGGAIARSNARCPVCKALERHRFVWLFFQQHTDLFVSTPKRMLHFAPEKSLMPQLKKLTHLDYITADLYKKAMVKVDITDIQYPEESFDIVYCSHVLEHIDRDRKAIQELYRVLKFQGWAILMVPISGEKTFEDLSITDPAERKRLFGQHNHVRQYGKDFKERLEEAGFDVKAIYSREILSTEDMERFAIPATENPMYYCKKNGTS
jgi:predicted SAM-dependent methyltransferase